ncbi:MAG TPA: hypothetical protein VMB03_03900 [Bryobacteraceae bacterium]|nr:hypothetical protein [Bryobacteraceae bacterium]
MTVTSAAHAAAPSLPLAAAFRPLDEAAGSGVLFANELSGVTGQTGDSTAAGKNLAKATIQQALALPQTSVEAAQAATPAAAAGQQTAAALVLSLPRTAAPAAGIIRPASTAKRPASSGSAAPKQSAEGNQTATVPVIPTPAVPVPTPLTAATDDSDGDPIDSDDSAIALKPPAAHGAPEEAPEPAAPAVTNSAEPAQAAPDMAFAARVQPADGSAHSTLPAEMASASAVASASKKIETAGQDEAAAAPELRAAMPAATAAMERTAEPAQDPAPAQSSHAATAAPRAEATTSAPESSSKSSAPLKDISLQVNQPGKERVDVRVVQQGSEVRVSVHTGDASLNTGLRQGLSELQSRLEETGYRSEMWRPGTGTAPVASAVSPQSSSNHSRGGDGQPQQQGGSQQDGGRRNPNSSNQPRWVEELESTFAAGEKSTGDFYGFSS